MLNLYGFFYCDKVLWETFVVIWIACVWSILKAHNNLVFRAQKLNDLRFIDKSQFFCLGGGWKIKLNTYTMTWTSSRSLVYNVLLYPSLCNLYIVTCILSSLWWNPNHISWRVIILLEHLSLWYKNHCPNSSIL